MDYGFVHDGKVFTPNGTTGISPTDNDDRNRAIEAAELAHWATQPDVMMAYYHIPVTQPSPAQRAQGYGEFRQTTGAYVSTWLGTKIGRITYQTVYRHNFGNPEGVVEMCWQPEDGWIGAVWCNEQDIWVTKKIEPTHWKPQPKRP